MIVKVGQNIWDIAMQKYGSIEGVFDIITKNNLSLSDELKQGAFLKTSNKIINKTVADYYNINSKPATKLSIEDNNLLNEGIGVWVVELNFIIN